ncbi:MAG: N-acetylmuramoyl-L-alanine amidase [Terriglobia bacterium]
MNISAWPFKSFQPWFSFRSSLIAAIGLAIAFVLWPARQTESSNFVFYLPNGHQIFSTVQIGTESYLPLGPLLNLVGTVTGMQQKRNSLKVWIGGSQLQFHAGDRKLKLDKSTIKLSAPFRIVNGQGLVPVDFIGSVLPRISGKEITYQLGTNRVFIGGVKPNTFAVQMEGKANGATLDIRFSGAVSVQTAASNGKWVVFIGGPPIQPMEPVYQFQNPYVKSLQFDDSDGNPKLIVTPGETGLNFYPQLSGDKHQLVLNIENPSLQAAKNAAPGSQAAKPGQSPSSASGAAGKAGAAPGPSATPAPPPAPALPVIVLDAGHGGNDAGAHSQDGVLEKNLVAQLASKVAQDIETAKRFRVIMTRTGDTDPDFEQRTVEANTSRAVAFVTFHAGDFGRQSPVVRLYTYRAPSLPPSGLMNSVFVPWQWAQLPHLQRSQALGQGIEQQLAKIQGLDVAGLLAAPVRQLRSINAPAVAVELGTLAPSQNAAALANAGFLKSLADAIAQALQQI